MGVVRKKHWRVGGIEPVRPDTQKEGKAGGVRGETSSDTVCNASIRFAYKSERIPEKENIHRKVLKRGEKG